MTYRSFGENAVSIVSIAGTTSEDVSTRRESTSDSATGAATRTKERTSENSSESRQRPDLEEVIVTAQKREQSLQDVPVSVSVFTEDTLRNLNAKDFADFADAVPGLSFAKQAPGGSNYIIRGIGQVGNGLSPTTAVYLDEVPLQTTGSVRNATLPDPRLFDIARVEVLRGPQGVIFGSSAMGGTVRIITNPPDATRFESLVDVGTSSIKGGGESWDVRGMVNIPLVDNTLAVRLAGTKGFDAGWIDDLRPVTANLFENADNPDAIRSDENSTDYHVVRAALAYTPDETLTITPSLFYQKSEHHFDRAHADLTFGIESRKRARYQDTYVNVESLVANLSVEKDLEILGGISILSSTSWLNWDFENQFDSTAFRSAQIAQLVGPSPNGQLYWSGSNNNGGTKQLTEEIRVTSKSASPWQYIAGLYFNRIDQKDHSFRPSNNLFGVPAPLPFGASSPPLLEDIFTDFGQQETAAFGEISYSLLEHWTISVGGRLFHYEQTDSRSRYGVGGRAGGNLSFAFTDENDETGFIPRVMVSWQPNDSINLYGGYSVGFRTGGINQPFSNDTCSPEERRAVGFPETAPPFESDTTKNLELGIKTGWIGGLLKIEGSVYSIEWQDFQQSVVTLCGSQRQFTAAFIDNAGAVDSRGAEVAFSLQLHENFVLRGGGSYTDAEYKEGVPSLRLAAGTSLRDVPKLNWNLSGEYTFSIGQFWQNSLRLSTNYVDDTISGFDSLNPLRPSYKLIDFMATAQRDTFLISLFVDNVTDETPVYAVVTATSPTGTNATSQHSAVIGQPRTIGLRLSKRFE